MCQNNKLNELFSALQNEMIAKAMTSKAVDHPLDKGDYSEINWIDWFNKYLPDRYKAAKATIIDSRGQISDKIDLVLYDSQYSYLAFNNDGILYLPAESVYAIFEVKQCINKENMEYAGEKAESVRKLYRTSAEIPYAGGTYPPKKLHRILAGLLTTSSDWSGVFGKPFKKCLQSYTLEQQIDCGCVLKSGSFVYDYQKCILDYSSEGDSLVFFFLQLLINLQRIGTVPAIDLHEYMKSLPIEQELLDG